MLQTKSIAGVIASALVMLACGAAAHASDWTGAKRAEADALIEHFMRPRLVPGARQPPALSVAIGIGGKLVLAKGYGEARPGAPAGAETIYHVGSLTKQFTAAAVLRLIEDGAVAPLTHAPLTLETPMSDVFEGVRNWNAEDEPPITIRSLLNMTSNLPNFTRRPPPSVDPWGAVPAPRLLAELKKLSPTGWPHSFEYSNTSYFLLAQAIEAIEAVHPGEHPAGLTYRDYIRAVTIAKAGMTHTGFVGEKAMTGDVAIPQYRRRSAFMQPDWLNGCCDLVSNAVDLFAWNAALMSGRIIGAQSRASMFSDGGRVDPVTYYGMGWFINHEGGWDSYSHSGSVPGYTSYNAIHLKRGTQSWMSITLLTNADGVEGLEQLAEDLFDVSRGAWEPGSLARH
jgi:CubicO group peptidase (beta-lactamase class C family)